MSLLIPIFGFYSADVLIVGFNILALGAISYLVTVLLSTLSTGADTTNQEIFKFNPFILMLTLVYVLFNRELLAFTDIKSYITLGLATSIQRTIPRVTILPDSSHLTRFYQPSLAIVFLLIGLILVQRIVRKQEINPLVAYFLLILSAWVLSFYPWLGAFFLVFLAFALWEMREDPRAAIPVLVGMVFLISLLVIDYLFPSQVSQDFYRRIGTSYSRIPNTTALINNFLLLGFLAPFIRFRMGRVGVKLQLANLAAISSSILTGYTVQPYHYGYISTLSLLLFIGCVLSSVAIFFQSRTNWDPSPTMSKVLRAAVVGGFSILIVFGAINFVPYTTREYFLVPESYVREIETLQRSCPPYTDFFSTDVAMWWGGGARSLCQNIVPIGLSKTLSDQEIAEIFSAELLHYQVISTKSELLDLIDQYAETLGDDRREPVRSMVSYSDSQRAQFHSLWYLFHSGLNNQDSAEYIKSLFADMDFDSLGGTWKEHFDEASVLLLE